MKQQFVGVRVDPELVKAIDRLARLNHRKRSDQLRFMLELAYQSLQGPSKTSDGTPNLIHTQH